MGGRYALLFLSWKKAVTVLGNHSSTYEMISSAPHIFIHRPLLFAVCIIDIDANLNIVEIKYADDNKLYIEINIKHQIRS